MRQRHSAVSALRELGFTEMEATVYAYLLGSPPATAYGIAKAIGKPVANTYKTVASLHDKGAILIDETAKRRCTAVPHTELLRNLSESFERRRDAAADVLARVSVTGAAEGIYSLTTPEQVQERCISMIASAVDVVLVDAFAIVLEPLVSPLADAAARGVTVAVRAYEPLAIEGAEVVIPVARARVVGRWPGQWVSLITDGAECLLGYLDATGERVHQAIWSESSFMAWPQHSYLVQELRMTLVENLLEEGASADELKQAVARSEAWIARDARGYAELLGKFGSDATS